jgi:hypothetical protein
MKTIKLVLLCILLGMNMANLLHGQTVKQEPKEAPKFMVHWQTEEPDHASSFRYLMACPSADCNTPSGNFDHYDMFQTEEEAMKFIENDFNRESQTYITTSLLTGEVTTVKPKTPPREANIRGKKFMALYALKAIPVKATEYTVEIPQPSKTEQRTKVEKQ